MRKLSLFALVLGFAACRGDSSGDDTPGIDSNTGGDYTIQQIQDPAMPACDPATPATCVNLTIKGVVITAIDTFGSKTGDFWIEEPGGGPFSGVHVYGAPVDQVAALALGDIVDLTGAQKAEFALSTDTSGNKLTELEPVAGGTLSVTKVSSGTPLEPTVVDALVIGQMSDFMARDAEWEKWEGVLIKVTNVQAFGADACVGTACSDTTLRSFPVTGDVLVESGLAAMPTPAIGNGDCLTSVTGVLDYFFNYQILPRTTGEIATGGSSCPHENMTAQCGDGIDNDGNGFKDCSDNQCVVALASCRMDDNAAIAGIQGGTVTGNVRVQNAIVTGVSFAKKDVWISTSVTAAANQGVQVHFNSAIPNTVTVGKTVDVIGKVVEFNDPMMVGTGTTTELTGYDITVKATAAVVPVPVTGQTAATLKVDATGEPYEGVLVQLTNVRMTTVGTMANNYIATVRQTGTDFKADDDIYRFVAADVTKCYTTITGIWQYNAFDNDWVLLPRVSPTGSGIDAVVATNQTDCN